MGIKLKNALSALSPSSGTKIGSVVFVGSGGPFDVAEGNTSLLLTFGKKRILVDCGPSVYASLRQMGMMDIDIVVITSTAEACMGSLGTLMTHLHYDRVAKGNNDPLEVLCADNIADDVREYLKRCGLGQVVVSVTSSSASIDIKLFPNGPADSLFTLNRDGMTIIYSGKVVDPVFDIMDQAVIDALRRDPSNVVVFHEASFTERSGCHYERLSQWSEEFKNFFIFGHSKEEGAAMIFNQRYMRSMATNDKNNEFNIEKQTTI